MAEIPAKEMLAPERRDGAAKGEERAKGNRFLSPLATEDQEVEGYDASGEDAQQDCQESQLPAEKSPQHGTELHVPTPHAAAACEDDDEEDPAAYSDPDERIEPRNPSGSQTGDGSD